MTTAPESGALPLLPLRAMTLLPGRTTPVELGRESSLAAVRDAHERPARDPVRNLVIVATQKEALIDQPTFEDLHPIGVIGELVQVLHGVPGRVTAVIHGVHRVRLTELEPSPYVRRATYVTAREEDSDPTLAHALAGALRDHIRLHDELLPSAQQNRDRAQALEIIAAERSPGRTADMVTAHLNLESEKQIAVLQELDIVKRLRLVIELCSHRINVLQVKRDLDHHVREHLSKYEHEAMLRHKLRAIQSELGQDEDDDDDETGVVRLRRRLDGSELPAEPRATVLKELKRLERMPPNGGEATITRTYIEWLLDLPWTAAPTDAIDLAKARELLEAEHHGLDKVKKRVIEYLSVRKLAPNKRGPILCLAGPPGVGKTSLARSIAEALGRTMVRVALGGVRDEADVRGHRRTYVGALPGRIMQGLKTAKATNPVFLLDEIDKLGGSEMQGDPAGALLETLDPETNSTFEDHYIDLPYDLSQVVFICTANDIGAIPHVLRDRLEIIEVSGYTVAEKTTIARTHLIPRARKDHGLADREFDLDDEALLALATEYTRESGVRNLQRAIEAVCRDLAMEIAEGRNIPENVGRDDLLRIHGPPRFHPEVVDHEAPIGVANGLGWTPTGGRILFVEASTTPGKGNLRLTGKLGSVMRESGETALSLIRSRAAALGVPVDFMERMDIHVHFPAGAVPKDGPSAGIAVTTALVSRLTGRPVRADVAMTGEVTLLGRVLAIGGVREKVLAAHRAGVRHIVLPEQNRKDEREIPEGPRGELTFHYVKHIREVLDIALLDAAESPAA